MDPLAMMSGGGLSLIRSSRFIDFRVLGCNSASDSAIEYLNSFVPKMSSSRPVESINVHPSSLFLESLLSKRGNNCRKRKYALFKPAIWAVAYPYHQSNIKFNYHTQSTNVEAPTHYYQKRRWYAPVESLRMGIVEGVEN